MAAINRETLLAEYKLNRELQDNHHEKRKMPVAYQGQRSRP
jgi:hypothetical protein